MIKIPSRESARRLFEFLVETGYSEESLQKTIGISKPPPQQFGMVDRLTREIAAPSPLNVLLRWFFLSRPVSDTTARDQLPAWFVESCADQGLIERDGDGWLGSCLISPYRHLLVASDLYAKLRSTESYDHVLGINPAAFNLLHFTIRDEVDSLLDLGAGCGIQALIAASHVKNVAATDLNQRCSDYLEFNARLNGIDNIESLTGDLFEPVKERTFDRIVSNPPFVLAPSKDFLYRDNDFELDGFCRNLAREAPAYLKEGGIFQMICEWPEIEGQSWQERIGEWFEGSPCDVWVMKGNLQNPSAYAETRVRETLPGDDAAASSEFREWMDYYDRMKIRAIHGGMVTMRRRTGKNWVRLETRDANVMGHFGDHVRTGLQIRDYLEAHPDDDSMLEARPYVLPSTMIDTQSRLIESEWRPTAMRISSSDGLRQSIGLEGQVVEFLAGFDGKSTLGELIDALTEKINVEPSRVKSECVKMARLLMERGFISPVVADDR